MSNFDGVLMLYIVSVYSRVDKLAFENTISEYTLYYSVASLWYQTTKIPREGYVFPADT